MKKNGTGVFKFVYFIYLCVLLLVSICCIAYVGSLLTDYEEAQPERRVSEAVELMSRDAADGTIWNSISFPQVETGKFEKDIDLQKIYTDLLKAGNLDFSPKVGVNEEGKLIYNIESDGFILAEVVLKAVGEPVTKLAVFNYQEWKVASVRPILEAREYTLSGLIAEAPENDNIYTVFVTDADGAFYGAIDLKELIIARSDKPLEELIYVNFPYVLDKESISENIERIRSYSEELIPVLATESKKILGVITSHDIVEIVDDELAEDYARLAALGSEETTREPVFKSVIKRLPWLALLLVLGLAVSAVVGLFEGVVKELPLIVCFQSLILGMAGNVGTQSLAVTVRAISDDELEGAKKSFGFIFKETRVALLNGFLIGLVSFIVVGAYLALLGGHSAALSFSTSACVGAALCFAMMISGFTGAAIPMFFEKIGIDPAVASGPLITTVNDLMAVVSYYGLAWLLLIRFT